MSDTAEARRHPRYQIPRLHASVAVTPGEWGDTYVSPTRDLSLGGAFLRTGWRQTQKFVVGQVYDVTLFVLGDTARPMEGVVAQAEVKRCSSEGLALEWRFSDPAARAALEQMISQQGAPG